MQHAPDAALHLQRRTAREGEQQDALRVHAIEHPPRDARRQGHRLAGAGAGDHQQRFIAVLDSGALLVVEGREGVGGWRENGGHR